uniref:Uncharacterized protein n=1 Tax=Romanomermis culicivorax TaxID=13658 RepID=A0A915JF72_ROMCU
MAPILNLVVSINRVVMHGVPRLPAPIVADPFAFVVVMGTTCCYYRICGRRFYEICFHYGVYGIWKVKHFFISRA